ncbi:hypothetical protein ANN_06389 [Periplaneta americana]|uniref:Uncharacterized protein n=1 Tax=Periplaneta americana TaxID=6978 RepID=A0ABQ8TEA2_PERAM|nr:hypothetical protein ANN_06389 [Periplaneta americana]
MTLETNAVVTGFHKNHTGYRTLGSLIHKSDKRCFETQYGDYTCHENHKFVILSSRFHVRCSYIKVTREQRSANFIINTLDVVGPLTGLVMIIPDCDIVHKIINVILEPIITFTVQYQSLGYLASEWGEGDNAGEMSPGSNTESYPAFAHIGLRENPGKNLNQRCIIYLPEKLPSKYDVHSEEYLPIRTSLEQSYMYISRHRYESYQSEMTNSRSYDFYNYSHSWSQQQTCHNNKIIGLQIIRHH